MLEHIEPDRETDPQGVALMRHLYRNHLMLVLVRHGQRGGRRIDRYPGKTLTPLGHRQARRVAKRVAQLPLSHIYTSDMARAYQTAIPLRDLRPDVPFTVLSDIRELSIADQPDHYPAELTEAERDVLHWKRINDFAQQLRDKHEDGEVVAVVCHGGFIRRLITALAGAPYNLNLEIGLHHASVTVVSISPQGKVTVRLANCTRHLQPSQIGGDVIE